MAGAVLFGSTIPALAASEALVTNGSPATPFPQNKQNEPAIARDPISGTLIAGSNDEIDLAPCTQNPTTGAGRCPFTPGVGVSGVYFFFDNGASWVQPTYSGFSARTGTPGVGPIGTLPNYFEAGLVSDGDPWLAVGPRRGADGHFAWANGSRYYYGNLTENFPGKNTLKTAFVAVAVSHTDDPSSAAAGSNTAWSAPSIASGKLNPVLFDDKNSMWVDNAASSPHFGRVYVSWTAFRAAVSSSPIAEPEPIMVAHSDDGGMTWSAPVQITPATNNAHTLGRQGSTIRTDSHGVVYLFFEGAAPDPFHSVQMLSRSFDGGNTFEKQRPVASVTDVGVFDPLTGRFVFDGFAGARTDSFPSVDIANGAPSGAGATNRIVLAWSDARKGLGNEESLLETSLDGGSSFSSPVAVQEAGDRPDFTAVAISPDGTRAFVVYDAFHAFFPDLSEPRAMEGVVRGGNGNGTGFTTLHRGASGDARGSSQNNMVLEFLGDYNQAVASNTTVFAVYNDVRNAQSCDAVNDFRTALRSGSTSSPIAILGEDTAASADAQTAAIRPFPPTDCPDSPNFGNSDIFGATATP